MAARKLNRTAKANASTLLEVVIAMVIIILVFGMAMMIYANVLRLSLSAKKIKAQAVLQDIALKAEQTGQYATGSLTIDDFRIEQEIKPFNNDTLLNEIHLTAYDLNQQPITELQKVLLK
jgi:Tfp pilus assembly protein PilE